MAALLKYEMKCKSEDCGKKYFVVVSHEELSPPNICPFCGGEAAEGVEEEDKE